MTKADIAEKVRDKLGVQRNESIELVDQFLEIMKDTLEAGEDIKISGFGKFEIRKKAPRPGRNPHTGEKLIIDGRSVLTFKPSVVLKGIINS